MSEDGPRSDDRPSQPGAEQPVLASDAERDHGVDLLRAAVVDGRLTLEEFSERVEVAQTARTEQELAALLRDLPMTLTPSASGSVAPAGERHRAFCSRISRSGPWSLPARASYRSLF